jgi:hypothetical protein
MFLPLLAPPGVRFPTGRLLLLLLAASLHLALLLQFLVIRFPLLLRLQR